MHRKKSPPPPKKTETKLKRDKAMFFSIDNLEIGKS